MKIYNTNSFENLVSPYFVYIYIYAGFAIIVDTVNIVNHKNINKRHIK